MVVQSTMRDSQYKPTPSALHTVGVPRRVLIWLTGLSMELWVVISDISEFDD
jgi:hypothetical protein